MTKKAHSLIRLSNSLRHYFGLETFHETDFLVDEWLAKHHFSCVAIMLIDGMGYEHVKNMPDSFMNQYCVAVMDSVFPPTTVAATTAFQTGKYPVETGWVGWHQFIDEKDQDSLILFLNKYYCSGKTHPITNFSYKMMPVSFLQNEIENGLTLYPAWSGSGLNSFEQMCQAILDNQSDHPVIYAYYDALDNLMHKNGVDDIDVKNMLKDISCQLTTLSKQLSQETGLIVIADHGHINVSTFFFEDDLILCSYFSRQPSIEGRACSFLIKDGKHTDFENYFNSRYGEYFHLYSRQDVYDMGLLGMGEKSPLLDLIIGDYLAVAYDCYMFSNRNVVTKGNHAGLTKAEREVPLILFSK